MSISQEFLDLCRAQLKLLAQRLDISLGIVYLTTEGSYEDGSPTLAPVVAYPETVARGAQRRLPSTIAQTGNSVEASDDAPGDVSPNDAIDLDAINLRESTLLSVIRQIDASAEGALSDALSALPAPLASLEPDIEAAAPIGHAQGHAHAQADGTETVGIEQTSRGQVVVPLTYGDMVLGALVITRVNQLWTAAEQHQIEQVAHSLAAGCVMERRTRWLNQKLHEQHLAYEAFHQQQDSMLDTLLHQLRNPLTAVQTFGKLLLRRVQPGESGRSAAEGVVRESDRIRLLLEQFDQVMAPLPPTLPAAPAVTGADAASAIADDTVETNAAEIEVAPVSSSQVLTGGPLDIHALSIDAVLEPLVLTISAIAQENQVAFYWDQPDIGQPPPLALADPGALQEVLSNLLDNAVKYTPAGGYVEVRTGITSDEAQTVLIADTGPGIPAEDQRHLFERRFRGVQAEGDIPGTGLGLAIAQELMQKMDGRLVVYSPAGASQLLSQNYPSYSAGTAIVLQLPAAPKHL